MHGGFTDPTVDEALAGIRERTYAEFAETPFRIVAIRSGRRLLEWNNHVPRDEGLLVASVAKSIQVSMLGIAIGDGAISSADDRVVDYFPALAQVPKGSGPKPGRHSRSKDREITFRHLASHVSGYLKPAESPGEVFHYQTFGINVLGHAIASKYGYYDPDLSVHEQRSGLGDLVRKRIRDPIGATWTWRYRNFDLPEGAKKEVFGNNVDYWSTALDLARLGWLWRCDGDWFGREVIPRGWIEECSVVSAFPGDAAPEGRGVYGQGFWVNSKGTLWRSLPEDSYAAWGGGHFVWVSPDLDLVIATSPLPLQNADRGHVTRIGDGVFPALVEQIASS